MKVDKHSIDYQINIEALREMEEIVPMTLKERKSLRGWVHRGHEIDKNPWNYYDSDGYPLNYLQAYRLKYGYSSGPWDYWKGSDTQPLWDSLQKRFLSIDEYY